VRHIRFGRWGRVASLLVVGLAGFLGLQRLAIIEWRVQLQLAAAQAGYLLPADIQQAGRGEIAPSPTGS
jgi:hypothetical protein